MTGADPGEQHAGVTGPGQGAEPSQPAAGTVVRWLVELAVMGRVTAGAGVRLYRALVLLSCTHQMGCTYGSVLYLHSNAAALSACPSPLCPCIHPSWLALCPCPAPVEVGMMIPYLPQRLTKPMRFNLHQPLSQENRSL